MALDRQRILNELGSVMNQLKSVDCGCMGKLFGQSDQTSSPSALPTCGGCRRNCSNGIAAHGGFNANESFRVPPYGNAPCRGQCNPPKLYADTYNYLRDNLMQPTIQEVYNDLKSLTPDNTVVNSPMANQMGLSSNNLAAQVNMGNMNARNMCNDYENFSQPNKLGLIPTQGTNSNQQGQMGGMGAQIMNMLEGNKTIQSNTNRNTEQYGHPTASMHTEPSPHGQIGFTPQSPPTKLNHYVYNSQDFSTIEGIQSKMQPGANCQTTGNINPATQQTAASHHLGHHSKGIAKFNEMFPGVMKNDLGFDPMAIAIQMNPANKQQAAINSMQSIMQNKDINNTFDTRATCAQHQQIQKIQTQQNNQATPLHHTGYDNSVTDSANLYRNCNAQMNSDQVYTAAVPALSKPNQQQYYEKNIADQNISNGITPPNLSSAYEAAPHEQSVLPESQTVRRVLQESILPADTSKYAGQKQFEFNTLGQPFEKTSAETYRRPEPNLPQTLLPQPLLKPRTDAAKYSKVKSTTSKTSLVGANAIGRTPSQLQHIYNQYRGSQSFTQQNIPTQEVRPTSFSESELNAPHVNQQLRQTPLEQKLEIFGGDTMANNRMLDQRPIKAKQVLRQIGDAPTSAKLISDGQPTEVASGVNRKARNGLQDMVYTSYPASSAWTFHGGHTRPCNPVRERYRSRY